MNTSLAIVIVVVIAVLGLGYIVGKLVSLRSGMLRAADEAASIDTGGLGLSTEGPTVLHFTATWCGPCAAVRRVVDQVIADLAEQGNTVGHVEIDMDENPEAARRLSVLSLPTTVIFDADGHPRYRTTGVPKAADLRSALQPLLA